MNTKKAVTILFVLIFTGVAMGQFSRYNGFQPEVMTPEDAAKKNLQTIRLYPVHPADPWREIDGKPQRVEGSQWLQFVGEIVEVEAGGVRLRGWYGPAMTWPSGHVGSVVTPKSSQTDLMAIPIVSEFFVTNFPTRGVEGEVIPWEGKFFARDGGFYRNGIRSLHMLQYGTLPLKFANLEPKAQFYFFSDAYREYLWVKTSATTASNTVNQRVSTIATETLVSVKPKRKRDAFAE